MTIKHPEFLPVTASEVRRLGWDKLDIILVSGDAYLDSPYIGVAVIGRLLVKAGFRVGLVAQPLVDSGRDIKSLGEPKLFWGITGGAVDSMVANFTASKRRKRQDDFTPGGRNDRRPDRAVIAYSNLIRRHFKNTVPLVLGGVEASLRRVAHYDYWSDSMRRSILFDARADYLVYGMGEKACLELAEKLRDRQPTDDIRGLCYISSESPPDCLELPDYAKVAKNKDAFVTMFRKFYANNDPLTARRLSQKSDTRYLVQNRPAWALTTPELDDIHALKFQRAVHPEHARRGEVRALETIQFSIPVHRGCYGECNFCSITVHQGRTVQWRSEASVISEAVALTKHPKFKGVIRDVGGPSANMYGFECERKLTSGACPRKRCTHPQVCRELKVDHAPLTRLLQRIARLPGVRRLFVASGIKHDLVLADRQQGLPYLQQVVKHHTSGQMKIAPEHTEEAVLKHMGKPGREQLLEFVKLFERLTARAGKKQFLTYYLIAGHPGCTDHHMKKLSSFVSRNLRINPRQVQIFTPLPSTWSALMYYTGRDPFSGQPIFVERSLGGKNEQKRLVCGRE